jgi:dipeptidyl-peptidase-4
MAANADDPQWSPEGARVAYVHDNDLYAVWAATGAAQRLTFDGSPTRINGDPDWLYSEEMLVEHAFSWSPTGGAIAFLSFDEAPVTNFPIQDYLPIRNTVEYQRYPLAGERNPRVALRVVDVQRKTVRTMYDGSPRDEKAVVDEILDRAQRHLRLEAFPADGGAPATLVRESDPHFVNVQAAPVFAPDGKSFLWLSERGGVQSLYRVDAGNGALHRLTGTYPVAGVLRLDARAGVAYIGALFPTRRDLALLMVPLRGGAPVNLTPQPGTHDVSMATQGGTAYIDRYSAISTPPTITRRSLRGPASATLFATPSLARYDLGETRAFEVPSRWGPLDALLTVPRDFDPKKRYPVIVSIYGGPLFVGDDLPSANAWTGLMPSLETQAGYLVFAIDGPASNYDRAANARLFWHSMGNIAMAGVLAGVSWLKQQPYVDAQRLGLYGWSYGGYLTAFTLTHAPGVFRSGIAGAPPADWRYYDSAYTERYMGTPQREPAAYRQTSVLPAAGRLNSQLLIIQGSSDDNVHMMNGVALLNAFITAGKRVDYFLYPGARHGVRSIAQRRHLAQQMLDWWERTL